MPVTRAGVQGAERLGVVSSAESHSAVCEAHAILRCSVCFLARVNVAIGADGDACFCTSALGYWWAPAAEKYPAKQCRTGVAPGAAAH